MQHADPLVARILFLDGSPNMQSLDSCASGKTSRKSSNAISRLKFTPRILIEKLTSDEEEHIDFLEPPLSNNSAFSSKSTSASWKAIATGRRIVARI